MFEESAGNMAGEKGSRGDGARSRLREGVLALADQLMRSNAPGEKVVVLVPIGALKNKTFWDDGDEATSRRFRASCKSAVQSMSARVVHAPHPNVVAAGAASVAGGHHIYNGVLYIMNLMDIHQEESLRVPLRVCIKFVVELQFEWNTCKCRTMRLITVASCRNTWRGHLRGGSN